MGNDVQDSGTAAPARRVEPTLVIMAAGMGSRFGGLKQIEPVGSAGEIILDFSLYDAMLAGFQRAVCVIKEADAAAFRQLLGGRADRYMRIEYAYQRLDDLPPGYSVPPGRVKPWGTAHAVFAARHLLHGPFAVINADDYYGPSAFQSLYDFLAGNGGDRFAGGVSESDQPRGGDKWYNGGASESDQSRDGDEGYGGGASGSCQPRDGGDRFTGDASESDQSRGGDEWYNSDASGSGQPQNAPCRAGVASGLSEDMPRQRRGNGHTGDASAAADAPASGAPSAAGAPVDHFCMVGYRLRNTLSESGAVSRGICETADGMLRRITERSGIRAAGADGGPAERIVCDGENGPLVLPTDAVVSMNVWGFTPSILRAMEDGFPVFLDGEAAAAPLTAEYTLPGVVDGLLGAGRADVRVLPTQDRWYGVTYRDDKEGVVAALQSLKDKGLYPPKLWR